MRRKRKNHNFKSEWENTVATTLKKLKIPVIYEVDVLEYVIPASKHKYRPDFKLKDGIYIETKGIFDSNDRKKILLLKEQRPDVKIFLLFQNANQKLYKGGKSTYADWCTKNGIEWSHKTIKKEWLNEIV